MNRIKEAFVKAGKGLWKSFPVLTGAILLVSLASTLIPKSAYNKIFSGSYIIDPIIGSAIGSILAGNPVTSYIIGGELLDQGISLLAVTSFLVAWVTVGIVQFPAESMLLGRRFAVSRNLTAFVSSMIVASITVMAVNLL